MPQYVRGGGYRASVDGLPVMAGRVGLRAQFPDPRGRPSKRLLRSQGSPLLWVGRPRPWEGKDATAPKSSTQRRRAGGRLHGATLSAASQSKRCLGNDGGAVSLLGSRSGSTGGGRPRAPRRPERGVLRNFAHIPVAHAPGVGDEVSLSIPLGVPFFDISDASVNRPPNRRPDCGACLLSHSQEPIHEIDQVSAQHSTNFGPCSTPGANGHAI